MLRKYIFIVLASFITFSCGVSSQPTQVDNPDIATPIETSGSSVSSEVPDESFAAQDTTLTENSLDHILPQDIIQEIGFFGGLGGGGEECIDFDYQTPTFLTVTDYPYEWMSDVSITVCGLEVAEEVHVTIELPDGTTNETDLIALQTEGKNKGEITFDYLPPVHSPVGRYIFMFTGKNWSLKYPLNVVEPLNARLYLYESQLFLINFSPREAIRLFVYRSSNSGNNRLIGSKRYQVDGRGDLQIPTGIQNAGYAALGEITGQVSVGLEDADIYCSGASAPIGLVPGGYAEILVDSLPMSDGGQINLGAGTTVQVVSNAQCMDGKFYWSVSCTNSECYGLVPESGPKGPYLRPIEQLPPTTTPDPAQIPACPGTKPTRLQVGMNAEVTNSGMAPQLSLRAQPGVNTEQVHVIAAGRDMVILQGPVCADTSYWWYIRSEQGFEGWAREGDNADYWIDPLP